VSCLAREARRPEEDLLLGIAAALDRGLAEMGRAVVREVVGQANRLGVNPDHLPYVFWALAEQANLPRMGRAEAAALELMLTITSRSGTMPNYSASFSVPHDAGTDAAINVIAKHLGTWAVKSMLPLLRKAYDLALKTQVRAVPKKTQGKVSPANAYEYLRRIFPKALMLKSRMFRDGELLLRVVRAVQG